MIEIFAVALLVFALSMIGMAIGVLAGRRRLGPGCAALGAGRDEAPACEACGRLAGAAAPARPCQSTPEGKEA
jgi:hypothetical protein